MNYLDLFAGIAGFYIGALLAGMEFENWFHSEIDNYANKVYKKRFNESISLGDITKINGIELKKKYSGDWIITGGFPCQDISIAGKGEGIHGKRSGLWFEYWRLIGELRPRFAIIENVGALVGWFNADEQGRSSSEKDNVYMGQRIKYVDYIQYQGVATIISNLAEIGYNVEWQDIRAEDMGAPHKRERIWIVAYPSGR